MPELMAEEAVKDAAPVDQAKDVCEDIVKAKEMCLAEVRSKEKSNFINNIIIVREVTALSFWKALKNAWAKPKVKPESHNHHIILDIRAFYILFNHSLKCNKY